MLRPVPIMDRWLRVRWSRYRPEPKFNWGLINCSPKWCLCIYISVHIQLESAQSGNDNTVTVHGMNPGKDQKWRICCFKVMSELVLQNQGFQGERPQFQSTGLPSDLCPPPLSILMLPWSPSLRLVLLSGGEPCILELLVTWETQWGIKCLTPASVAKFLIHCSQVL